MKKVVSVLRVLFLSVCLGCLSGCASTYYPTLPTQSLSQNEVEANIQEALKRSQEVESLKSIANVRVNYGDDRYAYRYAVSATHDNHLRIDILPQMGAFPLGILVASEAGVQFLDPSKKESYYSAEQRVLVEKAFGAPLEARELLAYFSDRIPSALLETGLKKKLISGYVDVDGAVWLVWQGKQYYWKLEEGLLKEFYLYDKFSRTLALKMEFYNSYQANELTVARTIKLEIPKQGVTALINFSTLVLNTEIAKERFKVHVPADYEQHNL